MSNDQLQIFGPQEWDLLTVVPDANPDLDQAKDVLMGAFACGDVSRFAPAPSMGEAVEFAVKVDKRALVVDTLNRAGFRIVEGGQR
jgi:hypothetical protein